jgi:hypothetical protein
MKSIQILAPNHNRVTTENAVFLTSYDSIILKIEDGQTFLDSKFWNFSKTTSKYRNQFLGETTKETEQKIKDGIYKLTNLN